MEQVVEKKKWLSTEEFRDSLSLAALVPGPFHVNLVGMTGYSLLGLAGGILSVVGFVLPGFLIAVLVAATLETQPVSSFLSRNPGVVTGMLLAVAGLLANVIVKLGRSALPHPLYWLPVIGLSALLFVFQLHIAAVILTAGLLFMLRGKST